MKKSMNGISLSVVTAIVLISLVMASSGISVYAADNEQTKYKLPQSTRKLNQFARSYKFVAKGRTSFGYDWTYRINRKSVKVTCKYDFKTKTYNFKVKGKKYGLTKVTFKYMKDDKTWVTVPTKIFVDPENYVMRTK